MQKVRKREIIQILGVSRTQRSASQQLRPQLPQLHNRVHLTMRALLMMTSAGAICRSLLTCAGSPHHRIRPVQLSSGVFIMSVMQPQSAGGWREGGCELVVLPIAALEADVFTS